MRVAVIGYGVEGRAAVDYWRSRGAAVVVHDRADTTDMPAGVDIIGGEDYLVGLDSVDLLVRSPSVRPDSLPSGVPVTTVVSEFLARSPAPMIGVTGTKGKGTTVTAIASILQAAGRRVFVGGNIGTPPLSFLPELRADDLVVLELSSFQLIDLSISPQIAVVLSVTPDHLNWHQDFDEYQRAKTPIAAHQQPGDVVVYAADNPVAAAIAATSPARRIPVGHPSGVHMLDGALRLGGTPVIDVAEVPLPGAHNLVNIGAAIAATAALVDNDHHVIRAGVRAIQSLPHRLQTIATRQGVTWVDDSLPTTPQTTMAAMAAFDRGTVSDLVGGVVIRQAGASCLGGKDHDGGDGGAGGFSAAG